MHRKCDRRSCGHLAFKNSVCAMKTMKHSACVKNATCRPFNGHEVKLQLTEQSNRNSMKLSKDTEILLHKALLVRVAM